MADNTTPHPRAHTRIFGDIEDIIADIAAGKMVIMVDDENRENEGDLIMAAEKVRPEDVNYMATHGRGLVCLTLSRERCKQLRLPLMVSDTDDHHATNFTISIEAAAGITTGISAHDRAKTIQAAVAVDARPEHLRQPGHIFPVMAQPGGVLTRAGHTEAGCDLARLAGLEPAAAIVEILNADGTMARRPDLDKFARERDIRIGTIADLIRYRLEKERNVERIAERTIATLHGEFKMVCYDDHINRSVHVALVKGDLQAVDAPLVRVHLQDTLGDVMGVQSRSLGWPLHAAIERISTEDAGVVVLLRDQETSRDFIDAVELLDEGLLDKGLLDKGLLDKGLLDKKLPDEHRDELQDRRSGDAVLRTYGVGAQILRDLGLSRIRVLSAPKQMHAISGFDLEIVEYV